MSLVSFLEFKNNSRLFLCFCEEQSIKIRGRFLSFLNTLGFNAVASRNDKILVIEIGLEEKMR